MLPVEFYLCRAALRTGGDWEVSTCYFLAAVFTIGSEDVSTVSDLLDLVRRDREQVLATSGSAVMAGPLLERLPEHSVLTIAMAVRLLDLIGLTTENVSLKPAF